MCLAKTDLFKACLLYASVNYRFDVIFMKIIFPSIFRIALDKCHALCYLYWLLRAVRNSNGAKKST